MWIHVKRHTSKIFAAQVETGGFTMLNHLVSFCPETISTVRWAPSSYEMGYPYNYSSEP